MVHNTIIDWSNTHPYILQLEQEGLVTRTFRRLDPERQLTILSAIVDEAIERGPTAINIKRVAERAGVSVGALYTYFPDRDGMLDFAVELCVRVMTDEFNSYRPFFSELPLREALGLYLTGGIEWGRARFKMVQFFARAAYHYDSSLSDRLVRPIATILRETTHDILTHAAARGEIREDVDLEAAARAIYGALIVVGDSQLLPYLNVYFQMNDEEMPIERTVDALLDLILRGISPVSEGGGSE
jgi:AcrR family transcriptional regulator